jgi:hypothetical protein
MMYKLQCEPIKKVRFQPWIGQNYDSRSPKLLVLGMSHYRWEKCKKTPDYLITNSVIGYWSTSKRTKKFFSNIAATCIGHLPNYEERVDYWNSVAFYNYIQEFVGDSPRQPHDYKLWVRSEPAFAEILHRLKPELILVIGLLNWRNITNLDGWEGSKLKHAPEPRYADTYWYPVGNGKAALAFHVKHVAAGYNFRKFAPLFRRAARVAVAT